MLSLSKHGAGFFNRLLGEVLRDAASTELVRMFDMTGKRF